MSEAAARANPIGAPRALPRIAPWLGAVVLAWLAFAAQRLAQDWPLVSVRFPDTDDAMRLVEVRDLLAGQAWFDLAQHRLDPPGGVIMHWSRLVDMPLAGLIRFFAFFTDPAMAERLAMAIWPPLVFLPAVLAMAYAGRILAGPGAGVLAALLAALCVAVHPMFAPGRIDHHNVQIALTTILLAATLAAPRSDRAALVAGAAAALMLGVGLETLGYVAAASIVFALRFVLGGPDGDRAALRFGLSLAIATILVFFATVPPDRWTLSVCDALGPNIAALAVAGGGGLSIAALALTGRGAGLGRFLAAALVGTLAAGLFVALEPACLKGSYGQIDPNIVPIWLNLVPEAESWATLAGKDLLSALIVLAFAAAGFLAAIVLLRVDGSRRDMILASASFLVVATIVAFSQVRASGYANIFAVPLVAALIAGAAARVASPRHYRAAMGLGLLLANPLSIGILVIGLGQFAALPVRSNPATGGGADCAAPAVYGALAREPAGTVAAFTEIGSFILAATPHRVLSGPYHRGAAGILDSHAIFTADEPEARAILDRRAVDYVAICTSSMDLKHLSDEAPDGLAARLAAGTAPAWLEPVSETTGPIRIWRVRR